MSQHRKVTLQLACAETQTSFDYAIPGDVNWLADHWNSEKTVKCPHCERQHTFEVKEAYLSAAISAAGLLVDFIG